MSTFVENSVTLYFPPYAGPTNPNRKASSGDDSGEAQQQSSDSDEPSSRFNPIIREPSRSTEHEFRDESQAHRKLQESLANVQHDLDVLRSKLSEVDTELRAEKEKREELEKELDRERKKRIEVENILNDVERECRTPFVVPAMMEAFKTISKVTTWTVNSTTST